MASIDYPFPNPKNAAEYEANRRAADDYNRQEQEAADEMRAELTQLEAQG